MSWRKTSNTRQGTSTLYGAADYNTLMDLLNGVDTGQPVNINNNWNFTRAPTGATTPPGTGSITTAMLADNAVTGVKIAAGTIDNTDISATAAIAKSKLANLGIVDADVASGAAIAKAKLAALNIADADVSATAAIAKSKLAALNIANADVAAAAAIAYSKLNLASSIAPTDLNPALGQPYQVPRINAAGTAGEYADPYMLPSAGRLYGVRGGWNGSGITPGTGMLNTVTAGNGTGNSLVYNVSSTDGNYCQMGTGTNNTFARAGWWANLIVMRKFNPRIRFRFRFNTTFVANQGILYVGFAGTTAQPAAGTSVLATYLDGKSGVLFGYRPADTHWMIISNNVQATATYTDTGLGAPDTNAHTLDIRIVDSPAAIKWSWDGTAQTDITDTTNSVPASTASVTPIFILEAQTATNLAIYERWSQLSMDWL